MSKKSQGPPLIPVLVTTNTIGFIVFMILMTTTAKSGVQMAKLFIYWDVVNLLALMAVHLIRSCRHAEVEESMGFDRHIASTGDTFEMRPITMSPMQPPPN